MGHQSARKTIFLRAFLSTAMRFRALPLHSLERALHADVTRGREVFGIDRGESGRFYCRSGRARAVSIANRAGLDSTFNTRFRIQCDGLGGGTAKRKEEGKKEASVLKDTDETIFRSYIPGIWVTRSFGSPSAHFSTRADKIHRAGTHGHLSRE